MHKRMIDRVARWLLCWPFGHYPRFVRRVTHSPDGMMRSRAAGWTCRRCGWGRVRVLVGPLGDSHTLRLISSLEQMEGRLREEGGRIKWRTWTAEE